MDGEDDLICDLAETYHIHDYRALSPRVIAPLACGLRPNSRTMMRESGLRLTYEQSIIAMIYDQLNLLRWSRTKAAAKGAAPPESLYAKLTGREEDNGEDCAAFTDGESYEAARQRILKGE